MFFFLYFEEIIYKFDKGREIGFMNGSDRNVFTSLHFKLGEPKL